MTCDEVRAAVEGFSPRYAADWEAWLATPEADRPSVFGRILRGWQAVRPLTPRRSRADGTHPAPFLDDVLADARRPLEGLRGLAVRTATAATPAHSLAIYDLWGVLERGLALDGRATCVGISKATALLTNGRIGPCLDSKLQHALGIKRPPTPAVWLAVLAAVAEDIGAFERGQGHPLRDCVPVRYRHLEDGRLYDMVFGPR
jgi:hypothetical protein